MIATPHRATGGRPSFIMGHVKTASVKSFLQYRTNTIERLLVVIMLLVLPLQEHIPAVAGFSIMYILFALLAGYTLVNRPKALARTWSHPVFLAAYTLLALAFLIESSHPHSSYSEIFRMALMILGAVFVASLVRDKKSLRAVMYGYLAAGVWVALYLFLTAYGTVSRSSATDFDEASIVRNEAFQDSAIEASPNTLAFYTAQGAVVALALALTAGSALRRNLFLGVGLFCLIANTLNMSRGGILTAVISCTGVMYACRVKRIRIVMTAAALAVGILIWVPDAVFSRLTFSTESTAGVQEARARVYTAAIEHLPEYLLTGVGAGNFWGQWGMRSSFARRTRVTGTHNGPLQATVNWGLAVILALAVMIYQAYRCLPKRSGNDALALCLIGIALSSLLFLQVHHVLSAKEFSLALGLLVGAHCWIWPKGIVQKFQPR